MKRDGRFTYKQLIGQTAINNIILFSDCMNPGGGKKRGFWKLLVRAVMKIYKYFFFLSLFW